MVLFTLLSFILCSEVVQCIVVLFVFVFVSVFVSVSVVVFL